MILWRCHNSYLMSIKWFLNDSSKLLEMQPQKYHHRCTWNMNQGVEQLCGVQIEHDFNKIPDESLVKHHNPRMFCSFQMVFNGH